MKVLKFGGSSVGTPESILKVKKIIESQQESCIVVVSAFGGVTDQLLGMANMAAHGDESYKTLVQEIEKRHSDTIKKLIDTKAQDIVLTFVKSLIRELDDILKGLFLLHELTPKIQDMI